MRWATCGNVLRVALDHRSQATRTLWPDKVQQVTFEVVDPVALGWRAQPDSPSGEKPLYLR